MAQDITLMGASYEGVPAVDLPKTGGGTARFVDSTEVKPNVFYGTCPTAAGTAAKVVTTTNGDFALEEGNILFVKFTNATTYNGVVTLNVDGTGAKTVCSVGTSTTSRYYWKAGEMVGFAYDGTNFTMLQKAPATTTYYGTTKLSSSTTSTSEALAATPKAVKTAYDLANGKQDALVSGTNIKTINNESLLGSGNISIGGGGAWNDITSEFEGEGAGSSFYAWENGSIMMVVLAGYDMDGGGAIVFPSSVASVLDSSFNGYTAAYDAPNEVSLALYCSPSGIGFAFGAAASEIYGTVVVPITGSPQF